MIKRKYVAPSDYRQSAFDTLKGYRDQLTKIIDEGVYLSAEERKKAEDMLFEVEEDLRKKTEAYAKVRQRQDEMLKLKKSDPEAYAELMRQNELKRQQDIETRRADKKNLKPHKDHPDPEMRYNKPSKNTYMPRTEAQKQATENYNKIQEAKDLARREAKEAAEKAAKEASPVNDMYKVGRKSRKPFFLKKSIAAIPTATLLGKIGAGLLTGGVSLGAEAAELLADSEESGAEKDMPDYWLERGIKDPEEQKQRARLSSFKKDLPSYSKIPGAYEKPELRKYKENVLQAEEEGTLRDNYVEDVQEDDDYRKFKTLMKKLR